MMTKNRETPEFPSKDDDVDFKVDVRNQRCLLPTYLPSRPRLSHPGRKQAGREEREGRLISRAQHIPISISRMERRKVR